MLVAKNLFVSQEYRLTYPGIPIVVFTNSTNARPYAKH